VLRSGWFFALFDWFAFKELMYASVSLPLFPQATEIFFFHNLNLNSLHKITTPKNDDIDVTIPVFSLSFSSAGKGQFLTGIF